MQLRMRQAVGATRHIAELPPAAGLFLVVGGHGLLCACSSSLQRAAMVC